MVESTLSPVGGPVSRERLAYEAIKEAILNFQLKPGQSLVENDLAAQLGTSKTPVRDALLRLEKEGLVVKQVYKGTYVADVNRQAMIEIFQIRAVLEGLAAGLAANNFSTEDIATAQTLINEHSGAMKTGDLREASRLNRQFHDLILQRSTSTWLNQLLSNIDDHLRRYRILSNFQSGRLDKSIKEHQEILNAIQAKKSKQAEDAMKHHLLSVLDDLSTEEFELLVNRAAHPNDETHIEL